MTRGADLSAAMTPARTTVRAGVVRFGSVVAAVLAAVLLAACGDLPGRGPEEIELEGGRVVQLPEGAEVVEVELTAAGRNAAFEPANVQARPGDVVRFRAPDGGTHALAFLADALNAEQLAFLERTNQLRAPPLMEAGAAWVVSLEGAPPGAYPFRCITHGEAGSVTVAAPSSR